MASGMAVAKSDVCSVTTESAILGRVTKNDLCGRVGTNALTAGTSTRRDATIFMVCGKILLSLYGFFRLACQGEIGERVEVPGGQVYSWLRTCSSLLGVSLCPKAPIACVEWIIACLSDDKKRILSMKKTRLYQW